jgi:hypothetical protein
MGNYKSYRNEIIAEPAYVKNQPAVLVKRCIRIIPARSKSVVAELQPISDNVEVFGPSINAVLCSTIQNGEVISKWKEVNKDDWIIKDGQSVYLMSDEIFHLTFKKNLHPSMQIDA